MSELRTDYKNDELAISMGGKRRYRMIENSDGTVSFEDVTSYSVVGDEYDADDINSQNETINQLNNDLTDYSVNTPLRNVTYYNGKLYQITSTGQRGSEIKMGMPLLNYANAQKVINTFVAPNDGYLMGTLMAGSYGSVIIDNKVKIIVPNAVSEMTFICVPIKSGTPVTAPSSYSSDDRSLYFVPVVN